MTLGLGAGNVQAAGLRRIGAAQAQSARDVGNIQAQSAANQGQIWGGVISNLPQTLSQGFNLAQQFKQQEQVNKGIQFQEGVRQGVDEMREQHLQKVVQNIKSEVNPQVAKELNKLISDKTKSTSDRIKSISQLIPSKFDRESLINISQEEMAEIASEAAATSGVSESYVMEFLGQKAEAESKFLTQGLGVVRSVLPMYANLIRKTGDTTLFTEVMQEVPNAQFQKTFGPMMGKLHMTYKDDPEGLADALDDFASGRQTDTRSLAKDRFNREKEIADRTGETRTFVDPETGQQVAVPPRLGQVERETMARKEIELEAEGFREATPAQAANPLIANNSEVTRAVGDKKYVKLRTLENKEREALQATQILKAKLNNLATELKEKGIQLEPVTNRIPYVGDALIAFTTSPEFQGFNAKAQQIFNEYRKNITGAAASFKELQALKAAMPTTAETSPEAFIAKTNAVLESLDIAYDTTLNMLDRNAFDIAPFKEDIALDESQPTRTPSSSSSSTPPTSRASSQLDDWDSITDKYFN